MAVDPLTEGVAVTPLSVYENDVPVELYVAVIVVSVIESTVMTGAVGYGIKVVTDFVVGVGPPALVGFTTKVYVVV